MLEVPPSSHWVWDRELDNLRKLFQRGEEERLTSMVYKGAQMMVNQPKLLKVGEFTLKAPLGLVPRLGRYQAGWEDETFGVKYNTVSERDEAAEKKGQDGGGSYLECHLRGTLWNLKAHFVRQSAQGLPWPSPQEDVPLDAEVDYYLSLYGGSDLWMSGGNLLDTTRARNELLDFYKTTEKNPSDEVIRRRRQKDRSIVRSWLAYGRKSPVTGNSIELPRVGKGSALDHLVPISTWRDLPVEEKVSRADTWTNLMVVENGANALKRNKTWEQLAMGDKVDPVKWCRKVFTNLNKTSPFVGSRDSVCFSPREVEIERTREILAGILVKHEALL